MNKKSSGFGINGWSVAIGHGLAHLQHATDRIVRWGFVQMKKQNEDSPEQTACPPSKKKTAKLLRFAKRGVGAGLRTIGLLGESYYERYEQLKQKEKSN